MAARVSNLRDDLIEVYLAQWRMMRTSLSRHVRSVDIAEDALQETWIRLDAMGRKDQSYVVRDRQAFLLRMASNIAIDLIRRERRHGGRALNDETLMAEMADTAPGPETIAIDRDQLRQLVVALAQLSPKARQALVLNRCDGLTHAEVAQRLGVSNSMVAKYLAQALRHCRDHFRRLDDA